MKYTIALIFLSNVIHFATTEPSAPVIEDLKPIEYGLNISWKSDVNSRQEKYEVVHKRNNTGKYFFYYNYTIHFVKHYY